ncbi:hypothetical protein [Marinicellulosiphila megalodicopiae]|uniref:hypothetical protein n=1 Tax=Marinicellulosiphila megalodicopiae TaxID=2724896 RepID=UPI003BB136FE
MKLNIAFNVFLTVLIFMTLNNTLGYILSFVLILFNLAYSKNHNRLWALSCIQCLILLPESEILALVLIAVSNIIYYFNQQFNTTYQNHPVDFIVKRIFVLLIIQAVFIILLAFLNSTLHFKFDIIMSILGAIVACALFYILFIRTLFKDTLNNQDKY